VPADSIDDLDSRLAWPCDRLVVSWSAEDLEIMSVDGAITLQLSVMQCHPPAQSDNDTASLRFAYLTIPVKADSVPLVITGIPDDGWWSLLHLIADAESSALFSQMGYDVLTADISMVHQRGELETAFELRIDFADGSVSAAGKTTGKPVPYVTSSALLVSGADYLSAFFGEEQGGRHWSTTAKIRIEGDTPLSRFGLPMTPATVLYDAELKSDRVFWRLPISQ